MCVCSLRYPACNLQALYCHLWPVQLHCIFPHYLINSTIFEKKVFEHKMCVLIFCISFVSTIYVSEEMGEIWSKMYIFLHLKYPLFLSDFNETLIFLTYFQKNAQVSNFIQIHLVGGKLFHVDEQTDMMKLVVVLRNFANTPKNRVQL